MKILLRLTHPISLGIILIFYSLLFRTLWFFYLLVLVFLGGVIILIIYIRTLAANEKFTIPGSVNYLTPIAVILVRTFLLGTFMKKKYLHLNAGLRLYLTPAFHFLCGFFDFFGISCFWCRISYFIPFYY